MGYLLHFPKKGESVDAQAIEQQATALIREYGVTDMLPVPLIQICRKLGIATEYWNFPDRTISGMIAIRQGRPFIYVRPSDAEVRQHFTIAHEIGHYVLHLRPYNIQFLHFKMAGTAIIPTFGQISMRKKSKAW